MRKPETYPASSTTLFSLTDRDNMQVEQKQDVIHDDIERAQSQNHEYDGDQLKGLETERVELTDEDVSLGLRCIIEQCADAALQDRRIRRKTDKRILAILCWIYFLQIFDKVVFGLGNVFGLSEDLKLTGPQYRSVPCMSLRPGSFR